MAKKISKNQIPSWFLILDQLFLGNRNCRKSPKISDQKKRQAGSKGKFQKKGFFGISRISRIFGISRILPDSPDDFWPFFGYFGADLGLLFWQNRLILKGKFEKYPFFWKAAEKKILKIPNFRVWENPFKPAPNQMKFGQKRGFGDSGLSGVFFQKWRFFKNCSEKRHFLFRKVSQNDLWVFGWFSKNWLLVFCWSGFWTQGWSGISEGLSQGVGKGVSQGLVFLPGEAFKRENLAAGFGSWVGGLRALFGCSIWTGKVEVNRPWGKLQIEGCRDME